MALRKKKKNADAVDELKSALYSREEPLLPHVERRTPLMGQDIVVPASWEEAKANNAAGKNTPGAIPEEEVVLPQDEPEVIHGTEILHGGATRDVLADYGLNLLQHLLPQARP